MSEIKNHPPQNEVVTEKKPTDKNFYLVLLDQMRENSDLY